MTSQQVIDKLIQIELYRIHPNRKPTREELEWEKSHTFIAKPFKRQYSPLMELDYEKEYDIESLDCDRGSPKIKLVGVSKPYDYKEFTYTIRENAPQHILNNEPECKYLEYVEDKFSKSDMYFLISNDSVKIGMTTNLESRIKTLSTSIPLDFDVYVFRGKGFAEKSMHNFFKSFHKRGEWFDMNHRIDNLINKYGEPVNKNNIEVPPHIESCIITFGKYKGMDICELINIDYGYCEFLISTKKLPSKVEKFIRFSKKGKKILNKRISFKLKLSETMPTTGNIIEYR